MAINEIIATYMSVGRVPFPTDTFGFPHSVETAPMESSGSGVQIRHLGCWSRVQGSLSVPCVRSMFMFRALSRACLSLILAWIPIPLNTADSEPITLWWG